MFWPIFVYLIMSIVISASTVINAGWANGLDAIGTSALFLVAGSGLKASLWWGDRAQKIGGPIFALVLAIIAQWLSHGFTVGLFGNRLTGAEWGWFGFAICFVFTDRRLAGPKHDIQTSRTDKPKALGKIVRRIVIAVAAAAAIILIGSIFIETRWRDARFDFYMQRVDAWVKAGGPRDAIQAQVVGNCAKLVMTQASIIENLRFLTYDRDEMNFRVDVCTKMTVNRIYKQPEFEKPELVKMICDGTNSLFRRLCQRSGLRHAE